ncbi:ComF family protein [Gluconobacter albidus]|uniref:Phosphoribosyltransferase n=2 Tax=Gluconobacter albidus TaxID=318683 RepID=A0ABQ5WZU2_9PROT|nr:ComF family protein [Gluconobacter albidus]MCP1273282.1 ComF family protein [Gluconobacter albidus]GBQ88787.1 competence protein F [Gluconobacter albidus NBRC 3250]GLQ69090.1 phosphoribosyltransferase [Gluconobacter albidus]
MLTGGLVARSVRTLFNTLLPPVCAACGTEVMTEGAFCGTCFKTAHRIVSPHCDRCGVPLENEGLGGTQNCCAACQAHPPVWRSARAAFVYDAWSRRLILPLKYSDHTENAAVLAQHMAAAAEDLLGKATLVVPVPLYRTRLWKRRYNQAGLMAQGLGRLAGLPCAVDALQRVRPTKALARLFAAEREREMAQAIRIRKGRDARIRGQAVLLVDDVLTTGSTATACTLALMKAGAASVDILVAARTGRVDEQNPRFVQE